VTKGKEKIMTDYTTIKQMIQHTLNRKKRFLDYELIPPPSKLNMWFTGTPDAYNHQKFDNFINDVLTDPIIPTN